jgi:sulfate adenylyltransferase
MPAAGTEPQDDRTPYITIEREERMVSKPHGETLVDLTSNWSVKPDEAAKMAGIELSREEAYTVSNIVHGVYSPLEGFMFEGDFNSVLRHSCLQSGLAWTIPVFLNISDDDAERVRPGQSVTLRNGSTPLAVLHTEEVFNYDRKEYAERVFGTTDPAHPGAARILASSGRAASGRLTYVEEMPNPYKDVTFTPKETRAYFKEKDLETVAAFQTRNAPHIGHEYLQKTALSFCDSVFINPIIGKKKPGDFKDDVIIDAYKALIGNYFPRESIVFGILRYEMQYAGPKEAIMHAIMRKNFGCTHIVIGRDHAGVGNYYSPYAGQEIFREFPDLGITPLFFKEFYYCNKCAGIANEKMCPHDVSQRLTFSGTKLREIFESGKRPPVEFMRPEVSDAILSHPSPFYGQPK